VADYNRVILIGRLTRDPQLSYTSSNTAVVEFGLATGRKWRGQDGQDHEETCFVDCNVFGRQAEVFNQYMTKGREVLVEGRLRFRQWETPEGQKRSKLSVTVESFRFMGGQRGEGSQRNDAAAGRPAGTAPGRYPARPAAASAASAASGARPAAGSEEEPPPVSDDEVPPPVTESDVPF